VISAIVGTLKVEAILLNYELKITNYELKF
jgi:hypothetical protein